MHAHIRADKQTDVEARHACRYTTRDVVKTYVSPGVEVVSSVDDFPRNTHVFLVWKQMQHTLSCRTKENEKKKGGGTERKEARA